MDVKVFSFAALFTYLSLACYTQKFRPPISNILYIEYHTHGKLLSCRTLLEYCQSVETMRVKESKALNFFMLKISQSHFRPELRETT